MLDFREGKAFCGQAEVVPSLLDEALGNEVLQAFLDGFRHVFLLSRALGCHRRPTSIEDRRNRNVEGIGLGRQVALV